MSKAGGVGIYVKNSLVYTQKRDIVFIIQVMNQSS